MGEIETFRRLADSAAPAWTSPQAAIDALIELDSVRDELPVSFGAGGLGVREHAARWADYYRQRAVILCRCVALWPSETRAAAAQNAVELWAAASRTADIDGLAAVAAD